MLAPFRSRIPPAALKLRLLMSLPGCVNKRASHANAADPSHCAVGHMTPTVGHMTPRVCDASIKVITDSSPHWGLHKHPGAGGRRLSYTGGFKGDVLEAIQTAANE